MYKKGKEHHRWKGGVSVKKRKCACCGKEFITYNAKNCSRKCGYEYIKKQQLLKGIKNGMWKGGRTGGNGKYIYILKPKHPFSIKDGYVCEHRLIIEKKIGRYLLSNEIVHHINDIKDDNRIKNLKLMEKKEHDKFHAIKRHKLIKKF